MKRLYIYACIALALPLAGCGNDSIDAEVTQYVTQDRNDELINDAQTNPTVAKAALSNVYMAYKEPWSTHDDFSLKAFHIATDMMCEDVAYTNWNWFQFDYQNDNREANYRRTNSTWRQFYDIISKVNRHLETFFAKESNDPGVLAAKGEALALRGIAYFHLVNFYQHTYKGHEDAPGVPLTLTTKEEKLPRASVKEVYAQIIQDLSFAVEHNLETSVHTDADKFVAAAYLAKVYAQMEDWANCEKYAAIAKNGAADVVSAPGRSWSIGEKDILWGFDINAQTSDLWASFWSHMDEFLSRGYAAGGKRKMIHNLLYNKIPDTDSRKMLWVNHEKFPNIAASMEKQSPVDEFKLNDYDQMKFVAGDVAMEQDYCFIRVQDPILLEIEAKVEQNKLGEAATLLSQFVSKRNPAFVAPQDQEGLRQEVRFQRRIELWMEGTNWFDMKRWKMTIDRTGAGTNHRVKLKMATDAVEFLHKLPISEIEANTQLVQNP